MAEGFFFLGGGLAKKMADSPRSASMVGRCDRWAWAITWVGSPVGSGSWMLGSKKSPERSLVLQVTREKKILENTRLIKYKPKKCLKGQHK